MSQLPPRVGGGAHVPPQTIEQVHVAACDAEAAGQLRDILLTATRQVEALIGFIGPWPVAGWDRASTLATLRDLTPRV